MKHICTCKEKRPHKANKLRTPQKSKFRNKLHKSERCSLTGMFLDSYIKGCFLCTPKMCPVSGYILSRYLY